MKGSGKILMGIASVTCLMLMYVHLQVASVIVSFNLYERSNVFTQKQELLRRLQFNVDQLKAPRLLEEKVKKYQLSLALPNKVESCEVPMIPELFGPSSREPRTISASPSAFSQFFGQLIQTAQAKTDFSS